MFELRVITSLAHINWLAPTFGARNDLISVFRQTLTLAKGRALVILLVQVLMGAHTITLEYGAYPSPGRFANTSTVELTISFQCVSLYVIKSS